MKFKVEIEALVRGYLAKTTARRFVFPSSARLARRGSRRRATSAPVAAYEDKGKCQVVAKFMGGLWACEFAHSPLDVVAWHGDYVPYKYERVSWRSTP